MGFVTAFWLAAHHCNFAKLENMHCDWLVCGLHDEKLQRRLFAKKKLMFRDALEEALTAEAIDLSTWKEPENPVKGHHLS